MQILIWVMMIVGGAAGLLSTAYLVLAMPIILVWKIFRVKSRFFCAVTSKRLRSRTACALSCAAGESSVSVGRNSTSAGASATAETIMGVPGTQA